MSVIIISLILINLTIEVTVYRVQSHTFCKDIYKTETPNKPIQPTNIFYDTDKQICLLTILENVREFHNSTSSWIDPNGKTFVKFSAILREPKREGHNAWETFSVSTTFNISKYDISDSLGKWKVEFYVDEDLIFTDFFELISAKTTTTVTETVHVPGPRNTITKTVTITSTPQEEPKIDYWTFSNPLLPIFIIIVVASIVIITSLAVSRKRGRY